MPLVGGLIGVAWYAAAVFSTGLPWALQSALVLSIPFVLSGFLHLDGYMDTADAFFSRRGLEEKKRILKDAHVGAFAVIALHFLLLIDFCAIQAILAEKKLLYAFFYIPIVSRCVTGMALLLMKPMAETGYMVMFKANTKPCHIVFMAFLFLLTFIAAFIQGGWLTVGTLGIVAAIGMATAFYLSRQFGGLSGDLCGCMISISEMAGLLGLAFLLAV